MKAAFSGPVCDWALSSCFNEVFPNHQFAQPKNSPLCEADLFKKVLLRKKSENLNYSNEEECIKLRNGLQFISSNTRYERLKWLFMDYPLSSIKFSSISQFWSWWHDETQNNVFRKLKWDSVEYTQLLAHGTDIKKLKLEKPNACSTGHTITPMIQPTMGLVETMETVTAPEIINTPKTTTPMDTLTTAKSTTSQEISTAPETTSTLENLTTLDTSENTMALETATIPDTIPLHVHTKKLWLKQFWSGSMGR